MPIRLADRAPDAYAYPLLIRHLLHTPLATAPEQEIVYRDRSRYTYVTLNSRIAKLASALAGLGVEPGMTVAVMDWDSHRYLECFFAIPMMGAVLQTVNIRLSPAQIAYTLQHAKAEVVLVHRDFVAVLDSIRAQLPALRAVVLIDDGIGGDRPAWIKTEYESWVAASSERFLFQDFDENALASTFYTTGTTGDPKGVCFSHRQLVLHTLAVAAGAGGARYGQCIRQGDVYMPMTPMFHVHAWGNPFVATLLGLKQVYPGRYVPAEMLALRTREGVTFSHCVPTILQMLLSADSNADMSGWKIIIGGSALPAGLAREARRRGIDVYAGYGMSETGPALTISRLNQPPSDIVSDEEIEIRSRAGVPLPLVDLRIVDANGADVPRDGVSVGEVVARTPWATQCYVGNPAASQTLWRGGYLHTQDVGRLDANGYLQIIDRMKDVIKTGGEWVSSLELEDMISKHPGIADVAVIAIPDPKWSERPMVLAVRRAAHPQAVTAQDIIALVAAAAAAGSVPVYAVPQRVEFVDALDRTSVGKINKRVLRERYS